MLQPIRRCFAATTIATALLLTVPATSQGMELRKPVQGSALLAQAWSWLESLLGEPRGAKAQRKDGSSSPPPPVAPAPLPPVQGPMIDPDGVR